MFLWRTIEKNYKNIFCGYSINEYPQHMFLWRTIENYLLIITKYPPYLFDRLFLTSIFCSWASIAVLNPLTSLQLFILSTVALNQSVVSMYESLYNWWFFRFVSHLACRSLALVHSLAYLSTICLIWPVRFGSLLDCCRFCAFSFRLSMVDCWEPMFNWRTCKHTSSLAINKNLVTNLVAIMIFCTIT